MYISVEDLDSYIKLLLKNFTPKVPDAEALARTTQILPLIIDGVTVDVALGLTGFESNVVARSSVEVITDTLSIPICSAEDLVIYKCCWSSQGHT